MMSAEKDYIDLFAAHKSLINSACGTVMNAPRKAAMEAFTSLGFPTNRQEAYRDCDLGPALEKDYGMNLHRLSIPVDPNQVFSCDVPNLSTHLYFILNDQFYAGNTVNRLPEGVLCGSLNCLSQSHEALLAPYYNKLAAPSKDGLAAFNTAFAQDGFVLYVPEGVVLEKPIQVINILRAPEDMLVQRRILVILEKGAQATLLFCDHALSSNQLFANQVAELFIGQEANLSYYELEMNHPQTTRVSHAFATVGQQAQLLMNAVTLNNGFTRNNASVRFDGQHAEAFLSGIVLAETGQFVDNHVMVDHALPNCTSNQLYKYVLDGEAGGIFAGSIMVRKDAQKTAAYQSNKNLCSPQSKMRARPQLEIYADDVKCSHGSATGQMDENALFYLRSRGISETEARMLMKYAFTTDVIDTISLEPLRDRMRMLIEKRFRGELARCAGCSAAYCH